ncbi:MULTISPECIES: maleylpyruvate isomerase family mycothiol-dependent enzyme [Mumia]|uniref:maleylpyruvate isomerase family mycothiol-dependent enzyme n=1 Tax=Mumia TaxID=1546255 RepID=UPI00141EA5EE|nr:maleylpyruvate isomerase family mycothiol-dependent enzyme [Mumia sp. ZJ430]
MTITDAHFWDLIHAERVRLVDMLEGLSDEDWRARTLCSDWTVDQVVAHLTAGASTGTWAWIRSMAGAGFNASRHNDRRLARYRGATPAATLEAFRRAATSTTAPTKDHAAWLGEVIVHGQDIARPLGVPVTPDPVAVGEVARFFAAKDFAVNSRRLVKGLALEADDTSFRSGRGPLLRGHLLDLVMAMAGRPDSCAALDGDGVEELRRRLR